MKAIEEKNPDLKDVLPKTHNRLDRFVYRFDLWKKIDNPTAARIKPDPKMYSS